MERIIIANRAGADCYKYSKGNGFELTQRFDNPDGQVENRELRNDKPGLGRGSYGSFPHYLDRDKKEYSSVIEQFAKELADKLTNLMFKEDELHLTMVAESSLLGKIRKQFAKHPSLLERVEWKEKNLENVPQNQWTTILDLPERPRMNHFIESVPTYR